MRVVFLGGRQAGLVGLLTVISHGCDVIAIVPRDNIVEEVSAKLGYPMFDSVKSNEVRRLLHDTDLLISVHSKEIVPADLLDIPRLGGINVHPCLYKYKGANPISRFIAD